MILHLYFSDPPPILPSGLDRFGRVIDQYWLNTSTDTATDRFQEEKRCQEREGDRGA